MERIDTVNNTLVVLGQAVQDVLPGRDRTSGEGLRGRGASTANEDVQWATGASQREQESPPSGGGVQPFAVFHPKAHQEVAEADGRCVQGSVLYF